MPKINSAWLCTLAGTWCLILRIRITMWQHCNCIIYKTYYIIVRLAQGGRYMAIWAIKSQVFQIKSRSFRSFNEKTLSNDLKFLKNGAVVFELWFFEKYSDFHNIYFIKKILTQKLLLRFLKTLDHLKEFFSLNDLKDLLLIWKTCDFISQIAMYLPPCL